MSEPLIKSYPNAPMPTERTLRKRRNLFVQAWRFGVGSINIMMMVFTGHKEN